MRAPLFTNDEPASDGYKNIRDAKGGILYSAKCRCEYLWQFFEPYADNDFRSELRTNFNARYWEMHLTTSLILNGHSVTCPKPGPDVGIIYKGKRIWFEAVSPAAGTVGAPDYVEPPTSGEAAQTPNEKMVLRYLNSISNKYDIQYANWLAKGTVSKDDAFIIAINPRNIPFEYADTTPPRILQAAYKLGHQYLTLDRKTGDVVGGGFHFRDNILKTAKADATKGDNNPPIPVTTGVFQDELHNSISALLCSRAEVANHRGELDGDYQLVPNPHADVPLPPSFRFRGTYFGVARNGEDLQVTPEEVRLPS
jgi:hypothetical protein